MGKLAIIGGGAAGLAAAVAAGEAARAGGVSAALSVTLYEADDRVGRSILATGNGRCNFSNRLVRPDLYHNAGFVAQTFGEGAAAVPAGGKGSLGGVGTQAETNEVLRFFAEHGLVWREDDEGRLYPATNKASTVREVLRAAALASGVQEACEQRAVKVVPPDSPGECFHVHFADGTVDHVEAVIVACGGHTGAATARTLLPETLPYHELRPVLGPLSTETAPIRALDNIRVRCAVGLHRGGSSASPAGEQGSLVARERGEVLFRTYGVSGIAVFNLSRFAEPGDTLAIDFFPQIAAEDMPQVLYARRARLLQASTAATCDDLLRGMLLPLVAEAVLARAGLRPADEPTKAAIPRIARALKAFPLEVRGIADPKRCQVTRGGFDVGSFDPHTLEARECPGLYVVGELLDVDAPCGGYNLHWAWASGLRAGAAAVWRAL